MNEELNITEREELEMLRTEKKKSNSLSIKVSQKGAVSIYGLGRFPVTLYKEQMIKLLDMSDEIRDFMVEHDGELKTKD